MAVRGSDTIIDLESGAQTEVDYYHHQIHAGNYFRVFDDPQTILSAGVLNYMFETGAADIHIQPFTIVSSADKVTIEFFESPTTTANGTALTPHNHNREYDGVTGFSFYRSPTVTADGTRFSMGYIPGATGTGGTRSGAAYSGSQEWVLKKNTKYLMKITNGSSGSNVVFFTTDFYKEV